MRLERHGRALVIDPGEWSEPEALQGAEAVVITHEHPDHVDAQLLLAAREENPSIAVFTHPALVAQLRDKQVAAQPVEPGDTFSVAGFDITVVGGDHAEIYNGLPGCANVGYVVDRAVYHPGDAFFVPDLRVDTLLVPVSAPWLKVAEAIGFVREIAPRRAHPIHDAVLSDKGVPLVDKWLGDQSGTDYRRLTPGESLEI